MTIEQAAQQLAEAVKAIGEAIKDDDPDSICINRNGVNVHVINKEAFRAIESSHASLDWHGNSKEYCKLVKRVAGVNFFTLIEAGDTSALYIPIPPDVTEKAMAMMRRDSVD